MPIIVAGSLMIKPGSREEFIKQSRSAVLLARENKSCLDFSVSSDCINHNRVNVFEKWASRKALNDFRNTSPENNDFSLIESFNVKEYELSE